MPLKIYLAAAIGAIILLLPILGRAQTAPCVSPEYLQFDFWIGDWIVYGQKGKFAGTNRIQREYGGCVLHERYDTGKGYSGESLNTYDASRKVWHQTWVDTSGTLLLLDGGIKDGKMVLEGSGVDASGHPIKHRITWSSNADGTVRQFWESTDVKGNWTVAFDGKYTRK